MKSRDQDESQHGDAYIQQHLYSKSRSSLIQFTAYVFMRYPVHARANVRAAPKLARFADKLVEQLGADPTTFM